MALYLRKRLHFQEIMFFYFEITLINKLKSFDWEKINEEVSLNHIKHLTQDMISLTRSAKHQAGVYTINVFILWGDSKYTYRPSNRYSTISHELPILEKTYGNSRELVCERSEAMTNMRSMSELKHLFK